MTSIIVIGYQPREGILSEDYGDFKPGTRYKLEDIDNMTNLGVLPPGLLLQGKSADKRSPVCVVRGRYNSVQSVEVVR